MKDLLTVEQAAAHAGVEAITIRAWHRRGMLPEAQRRVVNGRRRVLFTAGAVESMVQRICPVCGTGFRRQNTRQEYCSGRCRKLACQRRKAGQA